MVQKRASQIGGAERAKTKNPLQLVTLIGVVYMHVFVSQLKQTLPDVVSPTIDGYTPEYQPGEVAAQCRIGIGQLANLVPDEPINRTHVVTGNRISSHLVPPFSLYARRVESLIFI